LASWWWLDAKTAFSSYSFPMAIAMLAIGWLALRLFGAARYRLGAAAWHNLANTIVVFGLLIVIAPFGLSTNIAAAWVIGLPLLFIGAGARLVYDAALDWQAALRRATGVLAAAGLPAFTAFAWWHGINPFSAMLVYMITLAVAAIPTWLGWQFAEPPESPQHDARFGTNDSARNGGYSDEF
jgi:hypothetical protein